MPKLSEKTLEKRFQCEYCGETFRTRQGLSGHIQFKHHAKHSPQKIDIAFIKSKLADLKIWQATCQLPQSRSKAMISLLLSWHEVQSFCGTLDIELTKQDFKTYLLKGITETLSS